MADETSEKNPKYEEAREHFRAARKAAHETWEAFFPEKYLERRKAVRREFLLGLRSMIDAAIDRSEKK